MDEAYIIDDIYDDHNGKYIVWRQYSVENRTVGKIVNNRYPLIDLINCIENDSVTMITKYAEPIKKIKKHSLKW